MKAGRHVRVSITKRGHKTYIPYPHFSIVGYCNERHMEMYFVRITSNRKAHFVYSPLYAMQFENENDAQFIIDSFRLNNCSVKPMYRDQNQNVYTRPE